MARRCKDCPPKVEAKEIVKTVEAPAVESTDSEKIFSFPRFDKVIKAKTLDEAKEKLKVLVSYKTKEL